LAVIFIGLDMVVWKIPGYIKPRYERNYLIIKYCSEIDPPLKTYGLVPAVFQHSTSKPETYALEGK
jgi:hypothetical protein